MGSLLKGLHVVTVLVPISAYESIVDGIDRNIHLDFGAGHMYV